jgi:predicted ATPase
MPYLREIHRKAEAPGPETGWPYDLPAVRGLDGLVLDADVTILVGENGSGKSTLLEAVAVAWGLNAEGGSRSFSFATRPSHSPLHAALRLVRSPIRPQDAFFLRAESLYNVATEVDRLEEICPGLLDSSYGGRSLHDQSHGESFLALFQSRFFGHGLYFLDEPEAALSPTRQLAVLRRIHDLVREESQFLIATHSPILMGYPGAVIYRLDAAGYTSVRWEETEHYAVLRRFLSDRDRVLADLFRP